MRGPNDDPALADSAGALDVLIGRQAQIETLLDDRFSVDPDGARRAAKACRDQVHRIEGALDSARALVRRDNFGECAVGDSLSRKFAAKAGEGPDSVISMLTQARDLLARLAASYDNAAAGYDHTDESSAAKFRNLAERTGS